jgi:hypothetical protein
VRRAGARDQHRADHDIGGSHGLRDCVFVGEAGFDGRDVFHQMTQPLRIAIDGRYPRARCRSRSRRGKADRAGAQHHDTSRRHSGRSTQQDAAAAGTRAQQVGCDRHRHLAGDFADGGQHGQRSVVSLDDLAANGGDAAVGKRVEKLTVRDRHLIKGQQGRAGRALRQFVGLWPTDLDQQFRPPQYFSGRVRNLSARAKVLRIPKHRTVTRAGLHPDRVPGGGQPSHHCRSESHAPVECGAFTDHSNVHRHLAPH